MACRSLLRGSVELCTSEFLPSAYEEVRRRDEDAAIRQSAAFVLEACSTCPLGDMGTLREIAQRMGMPGEELGPRMELAAIELETVRTRREAAALEV